MEIVDGRWVPQGDLLRLWAAFIEEVSAGDPVELPGEGWRSRGRKYLERAVADPDFRVFVARRADHCFGLLIASLRRWPAERVLTRPDYVHISDVYVEPAERGRGAATALVQAALRWAADREVRHVDLNVLAGSPARGLYERLGFKPHSVNMICTLR